MDQTDGKVLVPWGINTGFQSMLPLARIGHLNKSTMAAKHVFIMYLQNYKKTSIK